MQISKTLSLSDHMSSDMPARCFACVKRRSECHYSHLADLIELLTPSLTQKIHSSDGRPGSRIVPWASMHQKESQNKVGMPRQTLLLPKSVILDFSLLLHIIGQDTDSSRYRMGPPTPTRDHVQGPQLAPLRCFSPIFPSPILQHPISLRPNILSGKTFEFCTVATNMSK